jgi:hypothetical protein
MFIAILTTNIMSFPDRILVGGQLDELLGAQKWSIDLDDNEKILRVFLTSNLLARIYEILKEKGFEAFLLNVYHCDYGIEYPLMWEDNPNQNSVSQALSKEFFSGVSLIRFLSGRFGFHLVLIAGIEALVFPACIS